MRYTTKTKRRYSGVLETGASLSSASLIISFAVMSLLIILALAGSAQAQEETTQVPQDGQTIQKDGMQVGDGEVKIGDSLYAGHGCVRVGSLTVGNCGKDKGPSTDKTGDRTTSQNETTFLEGTTSLEETTAGTPTPEKVPASCPSEPPKDAETARVKRGVDGDTIDLAAKIQGMDTVRFIGVDTPELDGEGGPEPYAEEAAAFTAKELEGKDVTLQIGRDPEDPYHRLLAYVWTENANGDPELFNLTLLQRGYARVLTIKPNDEYESCFEAAQTAARDSQEGLWSSPGGPDKTSKDPQTPESTSESTTSESATSAPDQNTTEKPLAAIPESTTKEATRPENTVAESTLPESTVQQDAVPESTSGPEQTTLGDSRQATESSLAKTSPDNCAGAAPVLDDFTGEHDANTSPFSITGGSFVVRTSLDSPTPDSARLGVSVINEDNHDKVTNYDQDSLGTYDTPIEAGPGSYSLDLAATDVFYQVAVFDCAGEAPLEETTQSVSPKATKGGGSGTQKAAQLSQPLAQKDTSSQATRLPATAPPTSFAPERTTQSYSPVVMTPGALPTQSTEQQGTVPVLPDTGGGLSQGRSYLLLLGVGLVMLGLSIQVVVAGIRGDESAEDRKD